MLIIGLTGSMATGKTALIRRIRLNLRWPIWDADAQVKKLYQNSEIIRQITTSFPQVKIETPQGLSLDKGKLRQIVIDNSQALQKLENILYPPLALHRLHFIHTMQRLGQKVIVLDIPLLFEKNLEDLCDVVVVTSCPRWLQEKRILSRPKMTRDLMRKLLEHQIPLDQKKVLGDIIVETGLSKYHSWISFLTQIRKYIDDNTRDCS